MFKTKPGTKFNIPITILITGVWLALLGWLAAGDYFSQGRANLSDNFQVSAAESDDWFQIRIGGAYSGFGRSRQLRRDKDWVIRDDMSLSLNIQGQAKPIKIVNESIVDENFRLISFHLKVSSGVISFEQQGRMEGRDLVLDIPKNKGGGVKRLKLYENPRMSRSLGLPVPLTGLKTGEEIHIPVFDPLDGNKWDAVVKVLEQAELEIAGQKVEAWRVKAIFRSVELVMWIDKDGRLLKGRMPLDMTVVRSSKEEVTKEMRTGHELPEIMSMSAVPVEGDLPDENDPNPVTIQIQGVTAPIPSDDYRQQYANSKITLTKESLPKASYDLPCADPKQEIYLGSSRFIRSDHPEIVKKAKEIVGGEKDPVKAAGLIIKWVHDNLKKAPTAVVPDAYTVLQTKQGACNEHAVLAAALARAVGLPTQIAIGLVPMEDGFAYHAWVIFWAGDRWFTADPLMGQMPVSRLHVTLLYGDVEKHMNVMSFLGKLKMKILAPGSA